MQDFLGFSIFGHPETSCERKGSDRLDSSQYFGPEPLKQRCLNEMTQFDKRDRPTAAIQLYEEDELIAIISSIDDVVAFEM